MITILTIALSVVCALFHGYQSLREMRREYVFRPAARFHLFFMAVNGLWAIAMGIRVLS
jgi:succinate dehydrogenase hydrophobic anchor subunit